MTRHAKWLVSHPAWGGGGVGHDQDIDQVVRNIGVLAQDQDLGGDGFAMDHQVDKSYRWVPNCGGSEWETPGEPKRVNEVFYLDLLRDPEAWRSVLELTSETLRRRTTPNLSLGPGDELYKRIKATTPWEIAFMQIVRQPKARRLPLGTGVRSPTGHQSCFFNDGETRIESDPIDALSRMQARFEKPVAFAVFIFGTAPRIYLGPGDDPPEGQSAAPNAGPRTHDVEDVARPMDPAYTEISFPVYARQTARSGSRIPCGGRTAIWATRRLRLS